MAATRRAADPARLLGRRLPPVPAPHATLAMSNGAATSADLTAGTLPCACSSSSVPATLRYSTRRKAGRWWSRLRGDARRQATAHQVGRGRRWPPGRRILGLGLVVVVLGGLWGIAAGVLVQTATDTAHPADALVVFAGGRGERLSKALVLVQQHLAPVLVISNGRDARWQAANQLCASRQRFEVVY